jgi:hypothetical protein
MSFSARRTGFQPVKIILLTVYIDRLETCPTENANLYHHHHIQR